MSVIQEERCLKAYRYIGPGHCLHWPLGYCGHRNLDLDMEYKFYQLKENFTSHWHMQTLMTAAGVDHLDTVL
jgi:hypothetical protein